MYNASAPAQNAPDAPNAADVARLVLQTLGPMSQLKLQKLVYYCQAASMAWRNRPIFADRIEAWANGPVVRSLWQANRYRSWVEADNMADGDVNRLSEVNRQDVMAVIEAYGTRDGGDLSGQTHTEHPWLAAREGFEPGQACNRPISLDSMASYYREAWG